MQIMKRAIALILAILVILAVFPGAALLSEPASDDPTEITEFGTDPTQTQPTTEPTIPSEETEPKESEPPSTSLSYSLEDRSTLFSIPAQVGMSISDNAKITVAEVQPDDEQMTQLCLDYDLYSVLDYFLFDLSTQGVSFPHSGASLNITFEEPFLRALTSDTILVFQLMDGIPVPIPVQASLTDRYVTKMALEPETKDWNSRYIIVTTDAPSILKEIGNQVAYMAVNTINNRRVGLSGNGISFTTSGIMWHYISDQRKPGICLQPNKTFQTSTAAVYEIETTTINGSGKGSVGGNVWDNLSRDQRRLIGLIALYGVQTHWDSSVGNAGLNTAYNLQSPTNPNQCLFAAQQIMAWEVVTGNRSATAPYTCYDSTLINAFGGQVPTKYAWLEAQLRAHDSTTSTIPSPENSTYRLAWLSSGFQTVMQVLNVEYETPVPPTASLTVRKTSTGGAGSTQQFTFKVFRNSALTSQIGATQYLRPGQSFSVTLDPNVTYYVAEVALADWNCTTSGVSTKTVNGVTYYYRSITPAAGGSYSLSFNNEPVVKKAVTLKKSINATLSCAALVEGNAMYSLADAEYSVTMNGVLQETLVTDSNGNAVSSKTYTVGSKLTIKETKAPKGYKLDTASYTHTIVDGTNTVSVSDVPLFDPPFVMTKVDSATTVPQGNGSFSGAVFKWEYFDNTGWTGTPKGTWHLATNSGGRVQYHPDYLASGYTSSDFFAPTQGNYQLPLGSLKITEVKNSLGYIVIQEPLYCTITQDNASAIGVAVTWTEASLKTLINMATGNYGVNEPIDTALFGSVTIRKTDAQTGTVPQGNAVLSGAEFEVINSSSNAVKVGETVAAPGAVCLKLTTNADGIASSGNVLPLGKYSVRESKAPAGYTLNTKWSQEFTVTDTERDFSLEKDNACPDEVIRGGLQIVKQDALLLGSTDETAALNGISFSVISENEKPVLVNEKSFSKGDVVLTLDIQWDAAAWTAATSGNVLPYGTYTVKENPKEAGSSMANDTYQLNTAPQTITISENGKVVSTTFLNDSRAGEIRIEKVGTDGSHLTGAAFLMQWSEDGKAWNRVAKTDIPGQKGGCTAPELVNGILRTPESGSITFTGLHPKLQYRVTEVEAPNGYALLKDAAYEGTIPADTLEISLRVVNELSFTLPQTGSTSMKLVALATALCTLFGISLLTRRKWSI